jgi:hypothetical protein
VANKAPTGAFIVVVVETGAQVRQNSEHRVSMSHILAHVMLVFLKGNYLYVYCFWQAVERTFRYKLRLTYVHVAKAVLCSPLALKLLATIIYD